MTEQISTQPYKGARDFYPEDMRIRNYIFDTWKRICESYGFEEYDFPILEPLEIFAAKTGQEIIKDQMFSLEDKAGRKLAIRPELTPGTVRMLAQRYKELVKPIRWFMVGNNWRYEKPQRGRGREFYQLEVNIFGVEDAIADFEIMQIIIDIMKEFGANETMFEIKLSDRRLISMLLKDQLQLENTKALKTRRLMDKRAKLSKEAFVEALKNIGLKDGDIEEIEGFMNSDINTLKNVFPTKVLSENKGYQAITRILELLESQGLGKYCKFSPTIIRGFDYSDGIVYEVFDKNPKNNRSLFGGERFDKLIKIFGNYELEATGFAMGDVTLLNFLDSWDLLPKQETSADYLVTLWPVESEMYRETMLNIATNLRRNNKVETWLTPNVKLEKQLKYANKKNIKNVVIVGEEELKNNSVQIKNMNTGKQEMLKLEKLFIQN